MGLRAHTKNKIMKKNNKYNYLDGRQINEDGGRIYDVAGYRLPSVTSILSRTKDQGFLKEWKAKVGEAEAERIKNLSSLLVNAMHKYLESYIQEIGYEDLTDTGTQAKSMAEKVIEIGLAPVDEYYGSEVTMYYPGLYAGQTDLVCMHNGEDAIVDFKQSNRPKKKEWIEDYFLQLGAYAMAHNHIYDTKINQGVILMCSKDGFFQKFEVFDKEFQGYMHTFLKKVEQYYANCTKDKEGQGTKND